MTPSTRLGRSASEETCVHAGQTEVQTATCLGYVTHIMDHVVVCMCVGLPIVSGSIVVGHPVSYPIQTQTSAQRGMVVINQVFFLYLIPVFLFSTCVFSLNSWFNWLSYCGLRIRRLGGGHTFHTLMWFFTTAAVCTNWSTLPFKK